VCENRRAFTGQRANTPICWSTRSGKWAQGRGKGSQQRRGSRSAGNSRKSTLSKKSFKEDSCHIETRVICDKRSTEENKMASMRGDSLRSWKRRVGDEKKKKKLDHRRTSALYESRNFECACLRLTPWDFRACFCSKRSKKGNAGRKGGNLAQKELGRGEYKSHRRSSFWRSGCIRRKNQRY